MDAPHTASTIPAVLAGLTYDDAPAPRRPTAPARPVGETPQPSVDGADPATAEPADPIERLPGNLVDLLAWAQQHTDKTVNQRGDQARTCIVWLLDRRQVDHEVAAIEVEEQETLAHLATLRSRKRELLHTAEPKTQATSRDYDPADVREWARRNSIAVPDYGRVPQAVLHQWRQAQQAGGDA